MALVRGGIVSWVEASLPPVMRASDRVTWVTGTRGVNATAVAAKTSRSQASGPRNPSRMATRSSAAARGLTIEISP